MKGVQQTNTQLSAGCVYLGMCCDPLHFGHIALIQRVRTLGRVVVGLLTDEAICSYKGKPFTSFGRRKEALERIESAVEVIPQHTLDYVPNLLCLRPSYVAHGTDWRSGAQSEIRERVIQTLKMWGGQLVEPEYTKAISSTLLRQILRERSISR